MRLRLTDVATVLGTALALWGVGLVLLLLITARYQAAYIRSSLSLDIHLKDDCSGDTVAAIQHFVEEKGWAREVQHITKEQAKEEYLRLTGDDFSEIIESNPLPQSLRIYLQPEFVDNARMALMERDLEARFGVHILEIVRKRELIQAINRNIYRISLVLGTFALVQMVVMLTLLGNAIRLAVYARRLTIKTMQLVGAHPGFIRRPFLTRALLTGFLSGVVAAVALALPAFQAEQLFPDLWTVVPHWVVGAVAGGVVLLGIVINVLVAWQIVNRLLRSDVGLLY